MHRPERSAWLRVIDRLDWPQIDLRVDMHDSTVAELRRIFETFKRYDAYYQECSRNPQNAKSEEDVTGELVAA